MAWDDLEYDDLDTIEDISDEELFELESATRIQFRDYSKHEAAVEAYEKALAQRRRYEEKQTAQKDSDTYELHSSSDKPADSFAYEPDPLLTALQVYDSEGYDVDGFNSQGFDREDYSRAGFNRHTGYDRGGYDIHGNSRGSDLTRFPKV